MSGEASKEDDKVGYKHPPTRSRFKKGRSGNPGGRQKGVRYFLTDLLSSLQIPVNLNENGKTKRVSTQEALILRLREKALKGDNRALENLVTLARTHNVADNATTKDEYDLSRLTDEELEQVERILTKASVVASDAPPKVAAAQ
jgi:hypothetical protein